VQTFATRQALEVRHRREEYLSFVAHDLRTPLSAISLAVRVLELTLGPGMTAEAAKMVRSSRRNVQHLEILVAKILEENANLETEVGVTLERREFDLWPLVEALIHDLHPIGGTDSTKLINDVPYDLSVYADAELIRRVFQNLIANAIKYTPRGTITIAALSSGPDTAVECSVVDSGSGIPESLLGRVFDKGEADPGLKGGTGLGLAIVKTFIEAHGGAVSVESAEGKGSAFRFSLPAKPVAPPPGCSPS
jgi:signal transduction histidine kinase